MELVKVNDIPNKLENTPTDLMELFRTAQQMEFLCSKENGIGLSAVQVGIPWRLFVVNESFPPYDKLEHDITSSIGTVSYNYYVDCEYEGQGQKQDSIEGCLSLRDLDGALQTFRVQRYSTIRVTGKWMYDDGEKLILKDIDKMLTIADKIYTVVFQHEIDHQNGILISDIGEPVHIRSV